jgi:hypothetical protein
VYLPVGQPKTVFLQIFAHLKIRNLHLNSFDSSQNKGLLLWDSMSGAQSLSKHASDAPNKLALRRLQHGRVA